MTNRLTNRFSSFLDRFESRLEVDCDRLKHQLLAQVDQQFGILRTKVSELRGCFDVGGCHDVGPSLHLTDPPMETVSLDEWIEQRRAAAECQVTALASRKRNLQSQPGTVKKRKTQTTVDAVNKKHSCKYEGCDRAFDSNKDLARHERIHMGIKPFSCSWPNCRFSSEQRSNVVAHVREKHFKLPRKKKGDQLITDERDPNQFVQVDNDLLQCRLE